MSRYERPHDMRQDEEDNWRALNLFGPEVGMLLPRPPDREELAEWAEQRDAMIYRGALRHPPCIACVRRPAHTATREGLCSECYWRLPERRDPEAPVHHEYRQGHYAGDWLEHLWNEPSADTIGGRSRKQL